jgi:hypothetical protein
VLYMNDHEVQYAKQRLPQVKDEGSRAVLTAAIKLLEDLIELTNSVSDGWAYWKKPCKAAQKLQELIQSGFPTNLNNFTPAVVTQAQLKAACSPIKAFMTREKENLQGKTLTFPN